MQHLVIEEPYQFVPPYRGKIWFRLFKLYLRRFVRKTYGIVSDECRGIEHLQESLSAGHGVVLAANHSRLSDPMVMGLLSIEAKTFLYEMASWHLFKQDWLTSFMIRRLGAFSLYREGVDRTSLECAIEILKDGKRPLVIFAEGGISRTNDRLAVLMEGTAFVARQAARRRAKESPNGKVVVHPVALKYKFCGDVQQALSPVLERIERRMSWQSQSHLGLIARITKVGDALVTLKELEYFGEPQLGSVYGRIERLSEHLLIPQEQEWLGQTQRGENAMIRVKQLRTAILPGIISGETTVEERDRLRRQLTDLNLVNQLSCYPRGYLQPDCPPERLVETVEGFEEDLTGEAGIYGPRHVTIEIGKAIEVSPKRQRGVQVDPLIQEIGSDLQSMIDGLADKQPLRRAA
jgi:hypothetical protein